MLMLFNAESYEESHAFRCYCNKVMAFCSVVSTVNLVKILAVIVEAIILVLCVYSEGTTYMKLI